MRKLKLWEERDLPRANTSLEAELGPHASFWTLNLTAQHERIDRRSDGAFLYSSWGSHSKYTEVVCIPSSSGRKAMTNIDSVLKSREITLPTKVRIIKAMVFPVFSSRCDSCTLKKAEHQRIHAFELWCWRRLLRVSWTARRSNLSI